MSDDRDHLADLLRHAREAQTHVQSATKEMFRQNRREQDAVAYKFIIMGEAANRLSAAFRARYTGAAWREMIGMRNILAHRYGHVDPDIVWDAVTNRLPDLIAYLRQVSAEVGDES